MKTKMRKTLAVMLCFLLVTQIFVSTTTVAASPLQGTLTFGVSRGYTAQTGEYVYVRVSTVSNTFRYGWSALGMQIAYDADVLEFVPYIPRRPLQPGQNPDDVAHEFVGGNWANFFAGYETQNPGFNRDLLYNLEVVPGMLTPSGQFSGVSGRLIEYYYRTFTMLFMPRPNDLPRNDGNNFYLILRFRVIGEAGTSSEIHVRTTGLAVAYEAGTIHGSDDPISEDFRFHNPGLVTVVGSPTPTQISFNLNGGTSESDLTRTLNTGSLIGAPPVVVHSNPNFTFGGWQRAGTSIIYTPSQLANRRVTAPMTFIAVWNAPVPTPVPTLPPTPAPTATPRPVVHGVHHAFLVGFEDGTIRPNNVITRAEVTTILFRLMPDAERTRLWLQTNPFPDVQVNNWFNNAVSTAFNGDIVRGMDDGTFQPERPMSRAEVIAVVTRFANETPYEGVNRFNDISDHWARGYINMAARMGWLRDFADSLGNINPDQPITRAEVAAIINRMLGRISQSVDDLLPNMQTWSDNANTEAWYYLYIQAATNSYTFVRQADGINQTWVQIIQPRNWTVLERPNSLPSDIN